MEKGTDYTLWDLKGAPNSMFKTHRANFINNLQLRKEFPENSVLLLKGGKEIPRYDTDVNHYHFYQESNFYYLTGVREPGFWAVLEMSGDDSKANLHLFYEKLPEDYKIWMTVLSEIEIAEKYEIDPQYVHPSEELSKVLSQRDPRAIFLLEGNNASSGLSVLTADINFEKEYVHLNERVKHDEAVYQILCNTRAVKTKEEGELLKFICSITNDAHKEIMKNIRPGIYERDLENVFMTYLTSKYYTRIWAYPCIGGCGVNSATLHYEKNDVMIKDGDFFLADMGIRFCNYTSDVTQTIPANGKFSKKQKEIYDIVLKSNRSVIAMMKPGVTTYPQMDKESRRVIIEELTKLGLMKPGFTLDDCYKDEVHRLFMPHGLGHLVGLDVHDVGFLSYKSEKILEPGYLITVEPGIYFIDFVLEKAFKDPVQSKYLDESVVRQYMGMGGVRIEDDILVTEDGIINLNADLPRTTEEIEEFMSKNNPYL